MTVASPFQFSKASGEVEARGKYVHVVARGVLVSADEVKQFYRLIERVLPAAGARRLLIEARGATDEPTTDVRQASWDGLSKLHLERVAYVVGGDQALKATRLNMTAISSSIPIRAFQSFLDAHRWLSADAPAAKAAEGRKA